MPYAKLPDFTAFSRDIELLAQLKSEHGATGIEPILKELEQALKNTMVFLGELREDEQMALREPDDLSDIRALRPDGPRRIGSAIPRDFSERLEGALIGRMAANVLGDPVEFWDIEKMQALAEETNMPFPPTDYWTYVPNPARLRYGTSRRDEYTRDKLNGVPVDDDLAYTLLGLLIMEEFGPELSVEKIGEAWVKYLPRAATAEGVALRNLNAGVPAAEAAITNNPMREWIGASIRADPWGYAAPGWPEKAAELAYHDAYISHRRQGIYGEMYFAAAISAAFALDDPVEALKIGLSEIPAECETATAIRWALDVAPQITDYRTARDAMEEKFQGMHKVHTINNACLTVWGITIGATDFTKVASETVAMGMDNDCTAATAGSLVGAVVGKAGISEHWYRNFNDTIQSYLIDHEHFSIADLVKRFREQAKRVWGQSDSKS